MNILMSVSSVWVGDVIILWVRKWSFCGQSRVTMDASWLGGGGEERSGIDSMNHKEIIGLKHLLHSIRLSGPYTRLSQIIGPRP